MSMITPSPAEIVLIKAEARRRFGSDRALCVQLGAPIGAAVVVAPFDLRSYSAHVDARAENASTAQAGAIVDRLLWCSPASPDEAPVDTIEPSPDDPTPLRRVALARLELLRDTWPAVDGKVEADLRSAPPRGNLAACPAPLRSPSVRCRPASRSRPQRSCYALLLRPDPAPYGACAAPTVARS